MNPQDATTRFLVRLRESLENGTWVELRLRPAHGEPQDIRVVEKEGRRVLSVTTHQPRQDLTKSEEIEPGLVRVSDVLAQPGSAWLATTARSWQVVIPDGKPARLVAHKTTAQVAGGQHDRAKARHLDESARDWLMALELVNRDGRPRVGRADKLHQIERYVDLLSHFAADCGWRGGSQVTLADMGCGRGYLTFAAWHLLRRALGVDATVIGVDQQGGLVATANRLAESLGAEGLRFQAGTIQEAGLPALDGLIALHACNDATDHAIRRGVEANAQLIVVAPCCHKDLRRALGSPEPIAPLLEHGLFKEHFSEWLTDGLRVLALEAAGYRVKVAEFVSPEHTPKNTLIAAIRGNTVAQRGEAMRRYESVKAWAGLRHLAVDRPV